MTLNEAGKMIDEQWHQLSTRFTSIQLDEYVIMPNHFNGIIIVGAGLVHARCLVPARSSGRAQGPPLVSSARRLKRTSVDPQILLKSRLN